MSRSKVLRHCLKGPQITLSAARPPSKLRSSCRCVALFYLHIGRLLTPRTASVHCWPVAGLSIPTTYNGHLQCKGNAVHEALHSMGLVIEPIVAACSVYNYRNKGQFAIQKHATMRPIVGLYEKGTNRVVETAIDNIHAPQILQTLKVFRRFLRSHKVLVYDDSTGVGCYRHIVIRTALATNQIMVCLVTASKDVKHLKEFVTCMKTIPGMKSIQWHYNPIAGDQVLRDKTEQESELCFTRVLSGRDYLEEEIAGVKLRVSLRSFLQSNPTQAAVLYQLVLGCLKSSGSQVRREQLLADGETILNGTTVSRQRRVWDLYCGVGSIALYLARTGLFSDIIGVESNPEAVRLARDNAVLNNITSGVQFIAGGAEDVITALGAGRGGSSNSGMGIVNNQLFGQLHVTGPERGEGKATPEPTTPPIAKDDIVILNPPRRGCDRHLLETLRRLQPRTVVYVSCNPTTLARDLQILTATPAGDKDSLTQAAQPQQGWRVMRVQPVDMFPHTVHVEVVAWLERDIAQVAAEIEPEVP